MNAIDGEGWHVPPLRGKVLPSPGVMTSTVTPWGVREHGRGNTLQDGLTMVVAGGRMIMEIIKEA